MGPPRVCLLAVVIGCSVILGGPSASALVTVSLEPSSTIQPVGATFDVDVVADFSELIVGFGIDLTFDSAVITLDGPPLIGPDWFPAFAPDGDGLAGLIPGGPIAGNHVLLATLTFTADAIGVTDLIPGVTAGDLTEGFALWPSGFDSVVFQNGLVTVVPEPTTCALVFVGLVGLALRARPRHVLTASLGARPGVYPGAPGCQRELGRRSIG